MFSRRSVNIFPAYVRAYAVFKMGCAALSLIDGERRVFLNSHKYAPYDDGVVQHEEGQYDGHVEVELR